MLTADFDRRGRRRVVRQVHVLVAFHHSVIFGSVAERAVGSLAERVVAITVGKEGYAVECAYLSAVAIERNAESAGADGFRAYVGDAHGDVVGGADRHTFRTGDARRFEVVVNHIANYDVVDVDARQPVVPDGAQAESHIFCRLQPGKRNAHFLPFAAARERAHVDGFECVEFVAVRGGFDDEFVG